MKMPGPYVPLDVNYARDRAIAAAGEEAELLYLRALAYCKGTFSEGFVPDHEVDEIAKRLKRVPQRIAALVREELWSVTDGGWLIRNWNRWNESSEEVQAKREREAERQRRKRERDKERTDSNVTADVPRDNNVTPPVVTPPKARQGKAEVTQGKGVARLRDEPKDDPTNALLIEHVNAYAEPPPLDAQRQTKTAIMRQVACGIAPERISAGLARMRERRVGPGLLPQLIAECSPVARPSTTDRAVATGLSLVEHFRAQESQ